VRERLKVHNLDEGEPADCSASAPSSLLIGNLSARSRHILAAMVRAGDCSATPEWLAERLFSQAVDRQEKRVQRYVRRSMRQLRGEMGRIDPVPGRETLIRDRTGYRLNHDNPVVAALIKEVQANL
jgi:hypothetical protein